MISGFGGGMWIGDKFVGQIAEWTMEIAESPEIRPQNILRAHHGRQYQYVWSDILQAHVRIGEDLKA